MAKRAKKRTQRNGQKRIAGTQPRNASLAAEPVPCDYCGHTFWRTDMRQRYCTPHTERKPAWQRRNALVELLLVTLRSRCGMTLAVARRMVELAERVLLEAVRRLGWQWDDKSRRFELRGVGA
jgi:hypothetical protein